MPVNWWQHVFLLAFDFCVKFLDHPKKLFLNQYSCFVLRSIWKVCLYPKRYTFCTLRFDSLDDVVEIIFIQFLRTIILIINLKIKWHDDNFCALSWMSVLCCPPNFNLFVLSTFNNEQTFENQKYILFYIQTCLKIRINIALVKFIRLCLTIDLLYSFICQWFRWHRNWVINGTPIQRKI